MNNSRMNGRQQASEREERQKWRGQRHSGRETVLYMAISFDGFLSGPNNELEWMQGTTDDDEMNNDIVSIITDADTGVIGYPTGSGMIPYWSGVARDPSAPESSRELARTIGRIHAILLSNKQEKIKFENAELLVVKSDRQLVEAMEELKRKPGRNIGVPGGVRTAQTFSRLGLIDEYVLMVHPVAIGEGRRLFTRRVDMKLVTSKTYRNGVMQVRYRPLIKRERN